MTLYHSRKEFVIVIRDQIKVICEMYLSVGKISFSVVNCRHNLWMTQSIKTGFQQNIEFV